MRGKIIRNILTPKSTKLHVVVENENQKYEKMSVQICPMAAILEFLTAILEFCRYFGGIFLLENVASSNSLILKSQIPFNSNKVCSYYPPNLNHIFYPRA